MTTPKSYVISVEDFILTVNGNRIDDWAGTGTVATLARVGAYATHNVSFASSSWVIGPPQYTLSLNVLSGGPSDKWLDASVAAFESSRKLWAVEGLQGAEPLFADDGALTTNIPDITWTTDAMPMRNWVIGLRLKSPPRVSVIKPAKTLTKAEVQEFA
jgi:hypothetical protein